MEDILRKLSEVNSELIDENILSQIFNREIKTWSNKNIPSVETSKNTFFKSFENKHQNDIGIIFFPGPSIKKITIENLINYIKTDNPNKNIIAYGTSRMYKKQEVMKYMTYYQFGDGYIFMPEYNNDINNLAQQNPNITLLTSAYGNNKPKNRFTEDSISWITKNLNAKPMDTGNLYNIEKDISKYPLTNHFNAPAAMQILLYTGVKKIYLVGSDCTLTTNKYAEGSDSRIPERNGKVSGYFYEEKETKQIAEPHYIYWMIRMKEFISQNYPETEIVSVNPVGLKGLFTDIYFDK